MSVIVTGMDMPENCSDCPINDSYGVCNILRESPDDGKLDNCPLKSVDGLIDAIKTGTGIRCKDKLWNVFTSDEDIIEIIRKYCGGKTK